MLGKIVTTLDVLSGGRAELGIGAGWYEREHLGLGVPFPPVAERFERLEETLRICLQMWDPAANEPFDVAHKLDVLRGHCDDVRRGYDEITKTILYRSEAVENGDTDGFVREVAPYADLGIDTVVVPPGGRQADWIERTCAPAVPRLAELG